MAFFQLMSPILEHIMEGMLGVRRMKVKTVRDGARFKNKLMVAMVDF
jgi:hypothetical protein